MEAALLKPFLGLEIIFSSLTSIDTNFLNREIFMCKTWLNLSLNEIYDMPTFMRREFYNMKREENDIKSAQFQGLK